MGTKNWGTEATKKHYIKGLNVGDFNHIHSGKRTERDNEQQPKEQFQKNLRQTTLCVTLQSY